MRKPYHSSDGKHDVRGNSLPENALDGFFWKGKNVLVTGSSGFAGRNLCNFLSHLGSNVRCFVRSKNDFLASETNTSLIVGDIQDYQSVLEALKDVDVAFHL